MSTEKWIAGATAGWANAFTASTLDSITNGNAILSDIAIDNSSNLDIFADLSFAFGSITWAAPNFLGIYLYPLNKDGSTYGDGRFGTSAAGPPTANYWVGNIGFPTGAAASKGLLSRIILPPGSFKFVIYNQSGATLAASGANTCQYRTYNRAIA